MDLFQFYPIEGIKQDEHFKRLLYNLSGKEKLVLDRSQKTKMFYSKYPYYANATRIMLDYYIDCKTGKKGDLNPAQFAMCKNGQNVTFSGDIMNGATLLQFYFGIIINNNECFGDFKQEWNQCTNATKKDGKFDKLYYFLYESKTVTVCEDSIKKLFGEPLYKYVCAVSQLGNFMPCPVGYNSGGWRGFADRMDIKLEKYYEKYFSQESDNPFKAIFESRKSESRKNESWEIFVKANFLQMYFEDNDYTKIIPLFAPNKAKPRIKDYSEDDWNKYFNKTSELINKRTEIIMQEIFTPHTFQPSV